MRESRPRRGTPRASVRETLGSPVPALLDVVTDPYALEVPRTSPRRKPAVFALAVGKIMLGGGVGDMVHMARANLRNIPI
jgi:pyruvate dehydrogenase (quinone)